MMKMYMKMKSRAFGLSEVREAGAAGGRDLNDSRFIDRRPLSNTPPLKPAELEGARRDIEGCFFVLVFQKMICIAQLGHLR